MNKKELAKLMKIQEKIVEDLKEDKRLLEFLQSGGTMPGFIEIMPPELSERYRERFAKFSGEKRNFEIINFRKD